MNYSVNDYSRSIFYLEERPKMADSQPVFGREVSQSLNVSRQIILETFQGLHHARGVRLLHSLQISSGLGLQIDGVLHASILQSTGDAFNPLTEPGIA